MSFGEVGKWGSGEVEKWRSGVVEKWRSGEVEKWRSGEVEKWGSGEVEKWRSGEVEKWRIDLRWRLVTDKDTKDERNNSVYCNHPAKPCDVLRDGVLGHLGPLTYNSQH
jgi:hypothetical protein